MNEKNHRVSTFVRRAKSDGSVTIPSELREIFGIEAGNPVTLELVDVGGKSENEAAAAAEAQ
jgi:bifunctional DNA-binding transcriptional regulator/antitoxin component of YhaV-PrlF toxin-antitoxin module